jgi:hypothetical protein
MMLRLVELRRILDIKQPYRPPRPVTGIAALFLCVVWYVYFCVLCLIVVPLPPGEKAFAAQLNNNDNYYYSVHTCIKLQMFHFRKQLRFGSNSFAELAPVGMNSQHRITFSWRYMNLKEGREDMLIGKCIAPCLGNAKPLLEDDFVRSFSLCPPPPCASSICWPPSPPGQYISSSSSITLSHVLEMHKWLISKFFLHSGLRKLNRTTSNLYS